MKKKDQQRIKRRTSFLVILSVLWVGFLVFRLIQFQVINSHRFREIVQDQSQNISDITPKRGTIYDRNNTILARSMPCPSVFLQPPQDETVDDQLKKIKKIANICELTDGEFQKIRERIEKKSSFVYIKRKIDEDKAQQIADLDLSGIFFESENKRFYPQGKLASHLIGRVDIDDNGQSGVEFAYNSVLLGDKGRRLILKDARQRDYQYEILEQPIPGKDLVLTIDETAQYIAEKELARAVQERKAKWGVVVISRPTTGEILALANYPDYDLNFPPNTLESQQIRAIHHVFDPGSTFKIITTAAALESGAVGWTDIFDCSQPHLQSGKRFTDHKKFEKLAFPDVIIQSSNIGTIQIGQRVGDKNMFAMIRAFNFGQKTGIDLPAEGAGIFRPLDKWTDISLASLSIGYEISVTAMQMLQAMNTIANKGIATRPMIVKRINLLEDRVQTLPHQYRRVLNEDVALRVGQILHQVTEVGTGTTASLEGYTMAGKTGTAQKYDPEIGTYSSSKHTASFVGFVPYEDPLFSMIVVIDEPQGLYYGGQVAAPVFREIAREILRYYRIAPRKERLGTLVTADNRRGERP